MQPPAEHRGSEVTFRQRSRDQTIWEPVLSRWVTRPTVGSPLGQFPPLFPEELPPLPGTYLEVFLIQDLLPPLDQEGSTDVQVEMRESLRLRLRTTKSSGSALTAPVGRNLTVPSYLGKPQGHNALFLPSPCCTKPPPHAARGTYGACVPGRCPRGGWCSGGAAPSSAGCSSSGRRTAGIRPRTSESGYVPALKQHVSLTHLGSTVPKLLAEALPPAHRLPHTPTAQTSSQTPPLPILCYPRRQASTPCTEGAAGTGSLLLLGHTRVPPLPTSPRHLPSIRLTSSSRALTFFWIPGCAKV